MSEWSDYKAIDITSAFVGITTPAIELYGRIASYGWEVDSLTHSNGLFTAKVSNEHKEKLEGTGNTESTALAKVLYAIERYHSMMAPYNARVAAYANDFTDLLEEVAHEYVGAKSYEKKAAQAWQELAEDCSHRVEVIRDQITVEVTDDPLPYISYSDMAEDILENQHYSVSRANADHPIWSINQVVDFRIAHDILGHAASGGDWSWFGLNRAFQAHAAMLSITAQKALFTEVVGKGAFHYYYSSTGPHKIAFLKIFDDPENPDPYIHAVHPSQTVVPSGMAKIPYEKNSNLDNLLDPNDGFESGVEPLDNNGYLWHRIDVGGEMTDPLYSRGYGDVVQGIKSDWHKADRATQEQAVANAFRNSFLKPGKSEQGHAQHYQAVHHFPGSMDDPHRLWQALVSDRDNHNTARGYMQAGKETDPFIMPLRTHIKFNNPGLRDDEVADLAEHHLLNMRAEEELEAKKKLGSDASAEDIHRDATRRLLKRLKRITNTNISDDYDFENQPRAFTSKHPDSAIYANPLAHHVKPISDVSSNIKEITNAALEDIHHGGKGHHFRNSLLKQYFARDWDVHHIDEAWHYLAPETNHLGVIDPEMLKLLGRKKDDLNLRDYFKAERELQAARDASGYGHMPLGQFSKSLKNTAYSGPGIHPDKDHLHVTAPKSHEHVGWSNRPSKADKPKIPAWFNETKKARKQVSKNWDKAEAIQHPKSAIPFKKKTSTFSTVFTPYYVQPDSQEKVYGRPGQTLMQHMIESQALPGQTTPEIWALNPDAGKEVVNGITT